MEAQVEQLLSLWVALMLIRACISYLLCPGETVIQGQMEWKPKAGESIMTLNIVKTLYSYNFVTPIKRSPSPLPALARFFC